MYKCTECGHIFEEGEERHLVEHYEYWGQPCSETIYVCPVCGGDYEKAVPCKICDSLNLEDDLINGVCKNCIDIYRKDFEKCYMISQCEKTEISINSLFASLFDSTEIEQILLEYIRKNCPEIDCGDYIDEDIDWFAEEVIRNENSKG